MPHDQARNNRKLLVSVFNPQEAREALLGGARIVDSEDPRSALGNIKPREIMKVSDAVLNYQRNAEVQLSTNIGEDQLLFDRTASGQAVEKSPYEIAGKAAQAALGVAVAMGNRVHPCNIVKVGLDAMKRDALENVLREVVDTLNSTEDYCHTQVMSVLFVQDLDLWEQRKTVDIVRRELIGSREFHPQQKGDDVFDLLDYLDVFKEDDGKPTFPGAKPSVETLIAKGYLPTGAENTRVALNDLHPHHEFGLTRTAKRKTDQEAIREMVDATAAAGADAIMLDTSILMKASRVSLVSTEGSGELIDFNALDVHKDSGLARKGILSLDDIRFFVDYCHYRGIEANLAGSFLSYHAQQIWRLVPEVDHISTRGGSSATPKDLSQKGAPGEDSRRTKVIKRSLVSGLIPPEQGGYLWLPSGMMKNPATHEAVEAFHQRHGDLPVFVADDEGKLTSYEKPAYATGKDE